MRSNSGVIPAVTAAGDLPGMLTLAAALLQDGRPQEASALLRDAGLRFPDRPEVFYQLAVSQQALHDSSGAIESYRRCISLQPAFAEAHNNLGIALDRRGSIEESVGCFRAALRANPGYVRALTNLGNALRKTGHRAAALQALERALELAPDYPPALCNLGQAMLDEHRSRDAAAHYRKALARQPALAEAHFGLGMAALLEGDHAAALECFERAASISPQMPHLAGSRLHAKMCICDWQDFETLVAELARSIDGARLAASPFVVLTLLDSPRLQRSIAEMSAPNPVTPPPAARAFLRRAPRDALRVGYFSADFRQHAVSTLMAQVFELHDRERFEVLAFSLGPDTKDAMRERLEHGFDRFLDVREQSDEQIAALARELDLDIAVDLGGYTFGARPGIFARRAAPVQLSYLGYLGTMGAPYMDYLIADPVIVPPEAQRHYAEKIVYLPSYQANDSQRRIAERQFSRAELGLPSEGFVFCCFNGSYKVTPESFSGWMRILGQVPGSVLFLYAGAAAVEDNLRLEAQRRGIDAQRLVFGGNLPMPEYLARYRAADLFLDTTPYNAGTTASDALWAGLPVLTRLGETFAGRVAGSLLTAVGLPELITASQEEYERLAVELGRDPQRTAALRHQLAERRPRAALFDTPQFVKHLEEGYRQVHERRLAGLPCDHLWVRSSR